MSSALHTKWPEQVPRKLLQLGLAEEKIGDREERRERRKESEERRKEGREEGEKIKKRRGSFIT